MGGQLEELTAHSFLCNIDLYIPCFNLVEIRIIRLKMFAILISYIYV